MNLTLSLKKCWFDLIKSGIKTEEYRTINQYWEKRLSNKQFDKIIFTLGYPSKNEVTKRITFEKPTIHIGCGKPEWGAEPHELYYIITWQKPNKNDKIMNAKEFYEAVKQMRKLQKDYFKYRINLEEAKAQEAKIDAEIERVENILHPKPTQTKLNF